MRRCRSATSAVISFMRSAAGAADCLTSETARRRR
jgi:hypothetical protein